MSVPGEIGQYLMKPFADELERLAKGEGQMDTQIEWAMALTALALLLLRLWRHLDLGQHCFTGRTKAVVDCLVPILICGCALLLFFLGVGLLAPESSGFHETMHEIAVEILEAFCETMIGAIVIVVLACVAAMALS